MDNNIIYGIGGIIVIFLIWFFFFRSTHRNYVEILDDKKSAGRCATTDPTNPLVQKSFNSITSQNACANMCDKMKYGGYDWDGVTCIVYKDLPVAVKSHNNSHCYAVTK